MTINPHPKEMTAPLKGTLRLKLIQKGHIFPVHIPVVDLPEEVMKDIPPEERWRGIDVHLQFQAVILCLN